MSLTYRKRHWVIIWNSLMSLPFAVKCFTETRSGGRLLAGHCQMCCIACPQSPEISVSFLALLRDHFGHGSWSHADTLQQKKGRCIPQPGEQDGSYAEMAEECHGLFHASSGPVQTAFFAAVSVTRKECVKGLHHIIVAGKECTDRCLPA